MTAKGNNKSTSTRQDAPKDDDQPVKGGRYLDAKGNVVDANGQPVKD